MIPENQRRRASTKKKKKEKKNNNNDNKNKNKKEINIKISCLNIEFTASNKKKKRRSYDIVSMKKFDAPEKQTVDNISLILIWFSATIDWQYWTNAGNCGHFRTGKTFFDSFLCVRRRMPPNQNKSPK